MPNAEIFEVQVSQGPTRRVVRERERFPMYSHAAVRRFEPGTAVTRQRGNAEPAGRRALMQLRKEVGPGRPVPAAIDVRRLFPPKMVDRLSSQWVAFDRRGKIVGVANDPAKFPELVARDDVTVVYVDPDPGKKRIL